jgi:Mrp family chromosome partitioning ATPase
VGGFIMVVRTRYTPRAAVVRAASLLNRDKLVGMVLNAEGSRLSKHRGYTYGYGYKSSYRQTTDRAGRRSTEAE